MNIIELFNYLAGYVFLFLWDPSLGILTWLYEKLYGPLTDRIYQYLQEHAQRGNPDSVIKTLDRFAHKQQWTFFIGDEKGPIMEDIVEKTQPMVCLELGSYVGYSAIAAARFLPQGARYYCVEPDEERITALRKNVEFAGLQDKVHAIQGFSNEVIPTLKKLDLGIDAFDYVFIDHIKSMYKSDLLLLEEHGLIKRGTVVVADNVIFPGAPDYLEYVRNSPKYRSEFFATKLEYCANLQDGVENSIFIG